MRRKPHYGVLAIEVSVDAPLPKQIPRIKRKFAHVALRIKHSPLHGYGVFAVEALSRGKKIVEYTGKRIPVEKALLASPFRDTYMISLNRRWVIDGARGGSGAQFINHSCQPNLRIQVIRGHIFFFSRRNIRAGEELTFRYAYPSKLRKVVCRCGAKNCRGYLRLFLTR